MQGSPIFGFVDRGSLFTGSNVLVFYTLVAAEVVSTEADRWYPNVLKYWDT